MNLLEKKTKVDQVLFSLARASAFAMPIPFTAGLRCQGPQVQLGDKSSSELVELFEVTWIFRYVVEILMITVESLT
jgi:hypothetical protein